MAITFAIEPMALGEFIGASPRDLISLHKRLIRVWAEYGILVDPGKGSSSIANTFAQEALMPVRKMWQDAWKAKDRCRRSGTPAGVSIEWSNVETRDHMATYQHLIEVALVEAVRGVGYLGIPDDDAAYGVHCGGVEAVLFPYIDESSKFSDLISRAGSQVVLEGSAVETVWENIFRPFLRPNSRIVVIDRYLSAPRNLNGFVRLLQLLSEGSSNVAVDIYASNPNTLRDAQITAADLSDLIAGSLNNMSCTLSRLAIVLVLDAAMTRDRYASFGDVAFHFGHGLPELLSHTHVSEDNTCTLDPSSNGIMRVIRRQIRAIESRHHERLEFALGNAGAWIRT